MKIYTREQAKITPLAENEERVCEYCDKELKNRRGLHIHWFYCDTKKFSEKPISYVKGGYYRKLLENHKFISVFHYLSSFTKYMKDNEVGIMLGRRYVLKELV